MKVKHPAVYTDKLIHIFADILIQNKCQNVLDPCAGTGKIALVKQYGFTGKVICNEIESEWADGNLYPVDEWHIGDAADMSWANNRDIWAINVSPVYGNRMSDHHNARDGTRRITYKHYLGRDLHPENTGQMQWGEQYRKKHVQIWTECYRILKSGGIFILNISDHIRNGAVVKVSQWHSETLQNLGFIPTIYNYTINTPRMRYGKNREARIEYEYIMTYEKPR